MDPVVSQLTKELKTLDISSNSDMKICDEMLNIGMDVNRYGETCIVNDDRMGVSNAIDQGAHLEQLLDCAIKYNRMCIASHLIDCGAKVYVEVFSNLNMSFAMHHFLMDAYQYQ